jgi:hypothetical protein
MQLFFAEHCIRKVHIFKNCLHFIEIKVVLEGRGFIPMFFGKREKAQKKILPLPLSLEPSASVFSA